MSIPVPLEGFGGGGGASLNFDVKAYATEEALLAAVPKENTIGVITQTAITSWAFSATEPAEPVAGMVWISTGDSSGVEFNALKKNAIQVYPLSAKQYVDGAWVDVTAMSYQGGEWVEWINKNALYYYGSQMYTWSASTMRGAIAENQTGIAPEVMINPDGSSTIYIPSSSANEWISGAYIMDNSIDLTDISLIEMHYVWYSSPVKIALSVVPVNADSWGNDSTYGGDAVAYASTTTNSAKILSVDVSNLSGKYLLCIGIQCSRNTLGGLTLQTVLSYT